MLCASENWKRNVKFQVIPGQSNCIMLVCESAQSTPTLRHAAQLDVMHTNKLDIMTKEDILKILSNENVVYHYTKHDIAIKYILYETRLRLSHRKDSKDPIENAKQLYSFHGVNIDDKGPIKTRRYEFISKYEQMLKNAKQICFCKNKKTNMKNDIYDQEKYGFLKPRMWDQYADGYKGVCLCFQKDELKNEENLIANDVEYITYKELSRNHHRIDENILLEIGAVDYLKRYKNDFANLFFRKHIDYENENEHRIISFSSKEQEYIDIRDSLIGLIVSNLNLSKFEMDLYKKYASENEIFLMYLYWTGEGVLISTNEEDEKLKEIWKNVINNTHDDA